MSERFVAFDVETTGLSPEACRLTEVAGVAFQIGGRVDGVFEELCQPGAPIPEEVSAITGITDAMVAHAPPPAEVVDRFLSFAQGSILVAHNASFDGSFVAAELERQGRSIPDHPVVDTLGWARARLRLKDFRLGTVARYFHLHPSGSHRASHDAHTAMGIFHALVRHAQLSTPGQVLAEAKAFPLAQCAVGSVKLPAVLARLPQYIESGARVSIEYVGGSQGELPRPVTPRGLTRIGEVSYLIAYCHRDRREKQFRLDRIKSLQPT